MKKGKAKEAEQLVPRPSDMRLRARLGGFVKNEIHEAERVDWTAEEYHSKHAGGTISRSELSTFADNPAQYRAEVMLGERRKISDAMRLGQCLHIALLEGHEEAVIVPAGGRSDSPLSKSGSRAGNVWKRWVEEYGPYYVMPDEVEKLERMVENVQKNAAVKEFLEPGGRFNTRHESTILAKHEPTGLRTRCRYDIESVWLFDIKKTANVSPQKFASHCLDFGYHNQGAFYQDHCAALHGEKETRPFILIAVQDNKDFRVAVYEMSADFVQIGRVLNAARLDMFAMYQAAWERMEKEFAGSDIKPDSEEFWTAASQGKIQYLNPPAKAMYQVEWEPEPLEVHKVLTERVSAALERKAKT